MSTRTSHDGADEQTWYAVIVDERYCLDSLNVDDALAEARRIAAANPRLSCRLVSFPVPRGRDPETTAYRLGVTDPNWGALWKNETTQPRTATAREPDATAPSSSRNGPWLLVGCAHRGGRRGFDVRRVVSPPVPLAAVDPLREHDQGAHGNSARRDDRDRDDDGDLESDCGGHPAEDAAGHGQRSCELGGNDPERHRHDGPFPLERRAEPVMVAFSPNERHAGAPD